MEIGDVVVTPSTITAALVHSGTASKGKEAPFREPSAAHSGRFDLR
jgi:hypothetical protein